MPILKMNPSMTQQNIISGEHEVKIAGIIKETTGFVITSALIGLLKKKDYSIFLDKINLRSLLFILEKQIEFLIIDIDNLTETCRYYLEIVKRTRPRLPIIILMLDPSAKSAVSLREIGIKYYAIKPLSLKELTEILEVAFRIGGKERNSR